MKTILLLASLAFSVALSTGCKDKKSGAAGGDKAETLPQDPCERLAACGIDKSCGGSLLGEKVHGKCGEEATCEKVAECVSDTFQAALAQTADVQTLSTPLMICGAVPDFSDPIGSDAGIKRACKTAFARMEQWVQNAAAGSSEKALGCTSLYGGAKMGDDFEARYKKACPE